MTKSEARQFIDASALPQSQAAAARRTINQATNAEPIEIIAQSSGDLLIKRSRPGRIGYQVLEDTISMDGSKRVVQKADDNAGNLTHDDPKGGAP
jgi:hypothetical protein